MQVVWCNDIFKRKVDRIGPAYELQAKIEKRLKEEFGDFDSEEEEWIYGK